MDKIMLNQMMFYAYHGVFPEETRLGQRFKVDAELILDLHVSGLTDNVDDSIDYGEVYNVVRKIVEGEPKNLIETVAESIANELFRSFGRLEACHLTVYKPDPPIAGYYQSVGVTIYRERVV